MKSFNRTKKAILVYLLNFTLFAVQVTAIGGAIPSYANDSITTSGTTSNDEKKVYSAFVPPGFTTEDFKVVEEVNRIAKENREREMNRNKNKEDVEHDISSSKCRTQAANRRERMTDITNYRAVTGQQGYDEICRLRAKLARQTGGPVVSCTGIGDMQGNSADINRNGELQGLEARYKDDPGGTVAGFETEDWEAKNKAAEERLEKARIDVVAKRKIVPEKYNAYMRKKNSCEGRNFGCTNRQDREELERLRIDYVTAARGLNEAEIEFKAAKKHNDDFAKPLRSEKGNMATAENDVLNNKQNMEATDNFSGATGGANGQLTGPVYETNEELKSAIGRYTANAAEFAQEKMEFVRELEFQNQQRGEYEIYELALKDYDKGSKGGKMALSNLDVMAMASAAIKKLKCNKKDDFESKAYHIFRAASATYVAAIIRDKGSNQDFNQCIKDEIFNENEKGEKEEKNDEQFEAVEKALNSHTQIVDSMCMTVNPDPDNIPTVNGTPVVPRERVEHLKKVCDASAGIGCKQGQEEGCAPRTRETALEMYNTALMIAQHELSDKRQLVATAEANVKKGKKKIKTTKRNIIVTNALFVMHRLLSKVYKAIGTALNSSPCGCGAPFIALSKAHWGFYLVWFGLNAYFLAELIKWTNFTKKWEKKLDKARNHTHLACNYGEAKANYAIHKNFAEDTKRKAEEAYRKSKEEVMGFLEKENLGSLEKKTGFFKMPKGYEKEHEKFAAEIYIKKYIKNASHSVFNLIFPSAMANSLAEEDNIDVASGNVNQANIKETERSAMAAGMAIGSTSFYHFVIRQNEHWQEQAFDADGKEGSGTGYVHNNNPIMYCNEGGEAGDCIKEGTLGMATPETRIHTITKTVALVQENLSGLLEHLDTAVGQRDKYVKLLNQMRNAMTLGRQGMDTQIEEKPVIRIASCMKKGNGGSFEIDKTCSCQATGTCASLQYPDIGEFSPGVVAENEAAVKKFADADLSGKLDQANVAAGELNKNSNAVRRKIRDNFKELNKEREKNNLKSIDYSKAAKKQLIASRAKSMMTYSKLFPSKFKAEKTRGGLSSYYNDANLGAGDGTVKSQPVLAAVGNTNSSASAGSGGKGSLGKSGDSKKDGIGFDFDFGVDDEGLSAEELARLRKDREDAEALARISKGQAEGSNSRYGHQRVLSDDSTFSSDNTGINRDTKKNIFGIISSRYKKSAFPIFLGDSAL
ncbi:MAG: hypothetical protein CME70_15100 [Halobacteriovorax sp.]|nr:hypothetical protein [Halobacteriovorax sp.]|tara:strand:- start:108151 stop:111780 length:3630 start_codon:yes stop_codon:yes gene_type:complete